MRASTNVDEEFTSFVASASAQLHRKAWLLTTSSSPAEDLLQSALAKAYVNYRHPRRRAGSRLDLPDARHHGWSGPPERHPLPGACRGHGQIGMDRRIGCGGETSADRARCDEILDAAGNVVGHRLTARWIDGVVINEVVLRRDSGTVYAASAKSLDDKWGSESTSSATRPPLTLDDLENLVRNDVWVSYEP